MGVVISNIAEATEKKLDGRTKVDTLLVAEPFGMYLKRPQASTKAKQSTRGFRTIHHDYRKLTEKKAKRLRAYLAVLLIERKRQTSIICRRWKYDLGDCKR